MALLKLCPCPLPAVIAEEANGAQSDVGLPLTVHPGCDICAHSLHWGPGERRGEKSDGALAHVKTHREDFRDLPHIESADF